MPNRSPLKLAVLAAATGAMVLTSGCAGKGGKNKDTAYVARDVDTLYAAAKGRLDRGDYKEAAALFDEVERQHPYSPWARRAQLMSAFSYYVARDYTKAIQSGQRFLSIHPGNKDAPYAYYLIAISYYEQISDVSRDQKITAQADWLAATLRFRNVVDTYQTTSHTPEALYRLVECYLSLGIPEEAQKAAAVLGQNYPGGDWYRKAYGLMNQHAPNTTVS